MQPPVAPVEVGAGAVGDICNGEMPQMAEAAKWLQGVNAFLGNQRPVDLLRCGRISEVMAAIEQTEAGSYA